MRLAFTGAIWLCVWLLAATIALAAQGGGRILTPLDVVAIRIVDHPDLDWSARVEPDGTINFPYVGKSKQQVAPKTIWRAPSKDGWWS